MLHMNQWPTRFPKVVGLDIETTGLDLTQDKILAIGISDGNHSAIIQDDFGRVVDLLENKDVVKVIHNALFDLQFIMFNYPCIPKNIWDSMLVEHVIFNGQKLGNGLEEVLARRMGVLLNKEVRETFIKHEGDITEEQALYLEEDVKYLPALRESQMKDVAERGLGKIVALENGAVIPTTQMKVTGSGFDLDLWGEVREQIGALLQQIEENMVLVLGLDFFVEVETAKGLTRYNVEDINHRSTKQVLSVVTKLGFKTTTTSADTFLEPNKDKHPYIALLLEHRMWTKMYTRKWKDFISPVTNRIHAGWKQIGTITGRFSCKEPPLQQVDRPAPDRPNIRKLFTARPNNLLLSADWSQQEPRLLSGISKDNKMMEAANEDDIYIAFAKQIWGVEINKKDPRRQLTKTGVLATSYGSQADGLHLKMGISLQECEDFQAAVKRAFPVAYAWGNSQTRVVKSRGYTMTAWGRRSYFPDIRRKKDWQIANDARNYPIQGSGADMLKLAMIKIYDIINKMKFNASFMLVVHDEVVLTVAEDQAQDLLVLVLKCMQEAGSEICPGVYFPAEGKVSTLWEH